MFLSLLKIDLGDNPDRPRPGRLWLRNLYRVHQRLCMAFPSASRKSDDEHFLKPFKPEDFAHGQVHVNRGKDAGFMFRVEPHPGGRVVILVQSAVRPDWDYAFHNAGHLLAVPWEVKSFDPCFAKGQHLRFRLVANPTKRFSRNSREKNGQAVAEKWVGKRVPVPTEQLYEWLARRAEPAGFSIVRDSTTVQPSYIYVNKTPNDKGHRLRSVRYDGTLRVTDPARFQETLVRGIGPGKAFGFGLLSVAPVNPSLSAEAT
ncbi:type I-E CRISPR-associated protein Cas6/Cse3/CasE [bacterium]|nr:type I-E CRISPR-associated protein Cas6/Cse3/CasE [bacterium]